MQAPAGARRTSRLSRSAHFAQLLITLAICSASALGQAPWQPHDPIPLASSEAGLVVLVVDPSGAVMQNSTVVLFNSVTSQQIESKTNLYGVFTARGLKAQPYDIAVSSPGFCLEETSATLTLGALKEMSLHISRASDFTVVHIGGPNFPVEIDEPPVALAVHNLQSRRVLNLMSVEPLPPPAF
jgi:Carboxypeptidase regulatory-like domain